MNYHRYITQGKAGKLRLSYNVDLNKWKMSGGKYGEHIITAEYDGFYGPYDINNKRVQAHWLGYIYNNR
jgi:hypothetical protein